MAEIGNLSSVIGAMCAQEGVVFPFGDRLESVRIHKDEGVLQQAHQVSAVGRTCGYNTENGIWLFFQDAILKKQHWDNIFVYSDMQAGHGGLYGIRSEDYEALGACVNGMYIDANMLVKLYLEQVNPRVNVLHTDSRIYKCACAGIRIPYSHPLWMDRQGTDLCRRHEPNMG